MSDKQLSVNSEQSPVNRERSSVSGQPSEITTPQSPIFNYQLLITKLRDPYLWLVLLLCLPAIGPLLQPGYFWGAHDARHSVYFLYEFNNAIQDGIWYPRWSPNQSFGFGYPFFNIYGPLSSYVGEGLYLTGFDIVTAVNTGGTADTLILQTVTDIDAGRANLYTQRAINAVTQARLLQIGAAFS